MSYQTLLYDSKNGVASVTINRPDKLNALNALAKQELAQVFESIKHDSSTHVVILTG
ncbi:MAG: enoyl-CoA hydratase/isomerase family protein, partial [Bacteroidota bacterium]